MVNKTLRNILLSATLSGTLMFNSGCTTISAGYVAAGALGLLITSMAAKDFNENRLNSNGDKNSHYTTNTPTSELYHNQPQKEPERLEDYQGPRKDLSELEKYLDSLIQNHILPNTN